MAISLFCVIAILIVVLAAFWPWLVVITEAIFCIAEVE